jgi:hypothetical protein
MRVMVLGRCILVSSKAIPGATRRNAVLFNFLVADDPFGIGSSIDADSGASQPSGMTVSRLPCRRTHGIRRPVRVATP